jgi:CO dehydrogenase maturation factor
MYMKDNIKLAITGKGGVGKTTIAALLCKAFSEQGFSVLAVDADPNANLASALGFPEEMAITPLVELKELIEERTGAAPGSSGGLLKLNPHVADLPEKLWLELDGIRLMVMGTVKKGGGGCMCPESIILKAMIQNLLLQRKEAVILDMEAGVEHLGRATAQAVDQLIVVIEPGKRSIETAFRIRELAEDIHLSKLSVIVNKVRNEEDIDFVKKHCSGLTIAGYLKFDQGILASDQERVPPWTLSAQSLAAVRAMAGRLIEN